jgi:putative redox protein
MSEGPLVTIRQASRYAGEISIRGHSLHVDRPTEKGGTDEGPMGGELLMAGLGGCFLSNLLAAIRERDSAVDNIEIRVTSRNEGTPPRMVAFELAVTADYEDEALMRKLLLIAERGCIASNTLRHAAEISVVLDA